MKKLKVLIIAMSGVLLVACSPRVNQPPPLSEGLSSSEEGIDDYTGSGPNDFGDPNAGNLDTDWERTGDEALSRRPGSGDWSSDSNLEAVYFAYDRYDLSDDARRILLNNAEYLRSNSRMRVLIEGNCDENGTEEYNQALGENRALAVREYLIQLGINPSRIDIISYGELRPAVPGRDEASRRMNRRAEFKAAG